MSKILCYIDYPISFIDIIEFLVLYSLISQMSYLADAHTVSRLDHVYIDMYTTLHCYQCLCIFDLNPDFNLDYSNHKQWRLCDLFHEQFI